MKINILDVPREFHFTCPRGRDHIEKDYGEIQLDDGELISLVVNGKKSDVVGKGWGVFVTQSTNSRLKNVGLRAALIKSAWDRYYVVVVDDVDGFLNYVNTEGYTIVKWLDEEMPTN